MTRTGLATLAALLTVTACGGGQSSPTSSPTTPTPSSPTPGPTPGPTFDWIVTHRFESVTGPDNCWVREQRARLTGVAFSNLEMSVTRSDNSIRIQSPWFQDYVGTFSGNEFSASGEKPLEGGGRPCADGSLFTQLPGVSNLSGRFSADDQVMTATEVNSYQLTSGEPVTYRWDWQATRRR
jgi:hypothetical protein